MYVRMYIGLSKKLLTCYYSYESRLPPSRVDAHLCTHVILIGNCMPYPNGTLIGFPSDAIVAQMLQLRRENPSLKLMISMTAEDNRPFSEMVNLV